jgi:hypothetical protein
MLFPFCSSSAIDPHAAEDVTIFCFAERKHAEQFRDRFGGEFINSATRPKRLGARTRRTDFSLVDHQRNGRCENCAD